MMRSICLGAAISVSAFGSGSLRKTGDQCAVARIAAVVANCFCGKTMPMSLAPARSRRGADLVGLPKRLVNFARHPELVHHHCQFPCNGHDGSFPGILASANHQTLTPAPQITVGAEMAQDVMSTTNQEPPHHMMAGVGDFQ